MTLINEMFKSKSKSEWRNVCTIDPGLGGTGWAYWEAIRRDGTAQKPDDSGVIRAGKGSVPTRILSSAGALSDVTDEHWADIVVIESPVLWSGSVKSQAAAESGNLFKLAMLIGAMLYSCNDGTTVYALITPHTWKGQMDKRAVHARIKRALGVKYREHEADAVGMGLAIQGVL